jgi:hypothetical protein
LPSKVYAGRGHPARAPGRADIAVGPPGLHHGPYRVTEASALDPPLAVSAPCVAVPCAEALVSSPDFDAVAPPVSCVPACGAWGCDIGELLADAVVAPVLAVCEAFAAAPPAVVSD